MSSAISTYSLLINDASWSSPQARAAGLRAFGVAYLGSADTITNEQFASRLAEKTVRILVPDLLRAIFPAEPRCLAAAARCEHEGAHEAAVEAVEAAAEAATRIRVPAMLEAVWSMGRAEAAVEETARIRGTWDAAVVVLMTVRTATGAQRALLMQKGALTDYYLRLSASLALEVLRELNSPGAAYVA